MELKAYRDPELDITFWRTSSGQEVNFVIGDKQIVLVVKGSSKIQERHLNHLKALMEEGPVKHALVICLEKIPRKIGNIHILLWKHFLEKLWAGEFV